MANQIGGTKPKAIILKKERAKNVHICSLAKKLTDSGFYVGESPFKDFHSLKSAIVQGTVAAGQHAYLHLVDENVPVIANYDREIRKISDGVYSSDLHQTHDVLVVSIPDFNDQHLEWLLY